MAKDRTPQSTSGKGKDEARSDLKPGTVEGELDFYDNCQKPIEDALKAAGLLPPKNNGR